MKETMLISEYNTSINIIRDFDKIIPYYLTPNAENVVNQIVNEFRKGVRAYNIIGTYGTGKSALLWAFQQSILKKQQNLFNINLVENAKVEVVNIIGEHSSILKVFGELFNDSSEELETKFILSNIYNRYSELLKYNSDALLIIIVDEFGKFLEYAAQNDPQKELYFIQQLAEFVNNTDYNICLITTVHQNFDSYADSLNGLTRQEWSKVKGRFKEITFNEPVEQLLLLATQHINFDCENLLKEKIADSINNIVKTRSIKLDSQFIEEIAFKFYPLDLLAATVLANSLQKYGQNERSLFSFLYSEEFIYLRSIDKNHVDFYNLAKVYDYLINNFYSFLNSKSNPDYTAWAGIRVALEKVDTSINKNIDDYCKIVKTIGLLGFLTTSGAEFEDEFLMEYAENCLKIENPRYILDDLIQRRVINKSKYYSRYLLNDSIAIDINLALIEASNKISIITDITNLIKRYYNLPLVLAKKYSFNYGTPRFFEYRISQDPISEVPDGEIDGFINLIFNEKMSIREIKEFSLNETEAIVYAFYKKTTIIKEQLFEIEKIQRVIQDNSEDKIVVKELNSILHNQQNLLNHYILESLYSNDVVWIFKGEELILSNPKELNKALSKICLEIYPKAPIFKNELINKHKISSSIHTAKKDFFTQLVNFWNKKNLGFDETKFPAHKTIYYTILKENGLHFTDEESLSDGVLPGSSFKNIWEFCSTFLFATRNNQTKVSDLNELLSKKPFKLKKGLVDIWIPTYLFLRRNDFALFGEGRYIPNITFEILELISKAPHKFEIKAFDLEGIKLDLFNRYRRLINKETSIKVNNLTFIETIKPFIVFTESLPAYTTNTKKMSFEALSLRQAILNSKDPEKTFFEDFPLALGFNIEMIQNSDADLERFVDCLQESIKELRMCFDELVIRFENVIIENFAVDCKSFDCYKVKLQSRFKTLKKELLLPKQKTFILRLDSDLNDRIKWLNSIAETLIGKSLDSFRDEDELLLYERFKRIIFDLDSLTNLSRKDLDIEKEEILSLEIGSFVDGINKSFVRFPKSHKGKITKAKDNLKEQLSGDNTLDIVVLINLLKELLKNE